MSRKYKAYASAYQSRDHESQMTRDDVQQYACDFNGALNDGETITSATWGSDRACLSLAGLAVTAGVATVNATANDWGCAFLILKATTSAGRVLSQRFVVDVRGNAAPTSVASWP